MRNTLAYVRDARIVNLLNQNTQTKRDIKMKNLTAIFSNGFTDTYKGKRDVKAGWAIIEIETGVTVKSGHSLTDTLAYKTAASNMPSPNHGNVNFMLKMGDISKSKARELNEKTAEFRKGYKIEVIAV